MENIKNIKNKLLEIEENVADTTWKDTYNSIYETVVDSSILLEVLNSFRFETNDSLDYLLRIAVEGGINRVRRFLNTTKPCDIYKIDDNGNLSNVSDDDFIICIEELIKNLKYI